MSEKEKGWKERRFVQFTLNPQDKMPPAPNEPESYLSDLKTNPARYGDEEVTPTTEGATPLNPAKEPTASMPLAPGEKPPELKEGAPTDSGTIPVPPAGSAKSV